MLAEYCDMRSHQLRNGEISSHRALGLIGGQDGLAPGVRGSMFQELSEE
jgi:hypothetical protein